jgi:hypothetical protein
MGFNSTLIIRNDSLIDIEKDPEFGKKVCAAIRKFGFTKESSAGTIRSGCSANAADVVHVDHADSHHCIIVGCNTAWDLGYCGSWHPNYHDTSEEERNVEYIRKIAASMGYNLTKKRKK